MNLHSKLLLSILACLGVVYTGSLFFQQTRMSRLIAERAAVNLRQEEAVQWRTIENLQRACDTSLTDSMVEGEMDKFKRLLAAQKQVEGLQELSVFSKDGVLKYSTDPALLKSRLPEETVKRIQTDTSPWRERTDESFVFYQPLPAVASCYECHPAFKKTASGGVYRYRFSTDDLKAAQAQWLACGQDITRASWMTGLLTSAALLVVAGGAITWLVRRQIARPLDAVGLSLQDSVLRLGQAAGRISTSSKELADGSQAQAASLEESSASLEETTSMAQRTAQDAEQTKLAAAASRTAVETAGNAMQQMHLRMQGIQQAATGVGKILKTIDEIAFQTNVLALNAAVEAARAGEAGAGFAVVAEEVRGLAQRCAVAARQTAELTEQVTNQVQEGSAISQQIVSHLTDILGKIEHEDQLVRQIAEAANQQGQGLAQVNSAITSIDQVTQRNARMSEDTAEAALDMNTQAEALAGQVLVLMRLINGDKAATAFVPSAGPGATPPKPA